MEISIYLLSRDNLKRPKEQLEAVFNAIQYALEKPFRELAGKQQIEIRHIGSTLNLPERVLESLTRERNQHEEGLPRINLLIDYSPIEELRQAIDLGHSDFMNRLWVTSPVDLVIRTASVPLLSNFLPLQSGYAIIWTSDKMVQNITTDDIDDALDYYLAIRRPFGS